jgi:Ca2+/Na+ antiporter
MHDPKPEFLRVYIRTAHKKIVDTDLFDEITGILLIVGLIFLGFAKEKVEDEFISKIREESLVWSTYFNYFILILAIIFCYDMAFYWVMVFNMFTLLIFFIVRFNWVLFRSKNQIKDEE